MVVDSSWGLSPPLNKSSLCNISSCAGSADGFTVDAWPTPAQFQILSWVLPAQEPVISFSQPFLLCPASFFSWVLFSALIQDRLMFFHTLPPLASVRAQLVLLLATQRILANLAVMSLWQVPHSIYDAITLYYRLVLWYGYVYSG